MGELSIAYLIITLDGSGEYEHLLWVVVDRTAASAKSRLCNDFLHEAGWNDWKEFIGCLCAVRRLGTSDLPHGIYLDDEPAWWERAQTAYTKWCGQVVRKESAHG